jgi:hypothetical protein
MFLVWSMIGIFLIGAGVFLFRVKRQRLIGTLVCLVGGGLIAIVLIALLTFHH